MRVMTPMSFSRAIQLHLRPAGTCAILCSTALWGLTACQASSGPTALPSTRSCSVSDLGSQDSSPEATTYLGLDQTAADSRATAHHQTIETVGRDGRCDTVLDLNLNPNRVRVYQERGKITWTRIG
ncbi:hypothetical protein ABIA33_003643 [Streptacidiphilus sp. MAP12-16]